MSLSHSHLDSFSLLIRNYFWLTPPVHQPPARPSTSPTTHWLPFPATIPIPIPIICELDAPYHALHACQTPTSQDKVTSLSIPGLESSTTDANIAYTSCLLCRSPIPDTLGRADTPPQPPQAAFAVLHLLSLLQHWVYPYCLYRKKACPALLAGRINRLNTIILPL